MEIQKTTDGDTGVFVLVGKDEYRILGIDTFELKSKNKTEKIMAIAAKNYAAYLLNRSSYVRLLRFGDERHHGRLITDLLLYIDGEFKLLSQEIVTHGLGFFFDYGVTATNRADNMRIMGINAKKMYEANKEFVDYWYAYDTSGTEKN